MSLLLPPGRVPRLPLAETPLPPVSPRKVTVHLAEQARAKCSGGIPPKIPPKSMCPFLLIYNLVKDGLLPFAPGTYVNSRRFPTTK